MKREKHIDEEQLRLDEEEYQKKLKELRDTRERQLDKIAKKFRDFFTSQGYNLIGFCNFLLENTFIFETAAEATKAHKEFEKDKKEIVGWWYGQADFANARLHYESKWEEIIVVWFDNRQ
jgi:hypothetical protein